MRRREILKLFVVGAGATALAARSWSLPLPVIGYLDASSASGRESVVAAFRDGLKELGFIEGQNVRIEQHWADNDIDRLPHLIADLVRQKIDVIFVAGNVAAQRVHSAVQAIPVVFVGGNDPVKLGLVKSLNQPSGNITGVTPLNADLGAKRLEVVHELLPTARLVGLLINPANPLADALPQELAEPAREMGLRAREQLDRQIVSVLIGAFPFAGRCYERVTNAAPQRLGLPRLIPREPFRPSIIQQLSRHHQRPVLLRRTVRGRHLHEFKCAYAGAGQNLAFRG